MTGEQIEDYIINELDSEPRHNCEALHTHSYGFHTANGRSLIEGMQNAYHEEVQFYVD